MIASRYNFWSRTPAGAGLLFNGRTGALLEMEPGDEPEVRAALAGAENQASAVLSQAGCLVDSAEAEKQMMLSQLGRATGRSQILELTIAPTYDCNFRCTYCYVHFEDPRMSAEVGERIINYVDRELPGYQQANITWFGGEPLLQWRQVADMAAQLDAIGEKHGRSVMQFLTTNGYLLTPVVTAALVEASVGYYHVTIDGSGDGQDQRRVLRNGQGTYKRVVANLIALLQDHPQTRATLRMNLELDSLGTVPALLEAIPAGLRPRIQVHATPVIRAGLQRPDQLHTGVARAVGMALEMGYAYYDNAIPVGRERHCTAESDSTFQIGTGGEMHKCSPSGKPEVTVGQLDSSGTAELSLSAASRWRDLGELPRRCQECRYLCFCGGGCRLERLRGTQDPTCADQYKPIEQLILNRWTASRRSVMQ